MIGEQYINYAPFLFGTVESVKIIMLVVIIIMLSIQHKRLKRLEQKLESLQV